MPIPLLGDRSAWDSLNYPERHANDLDDGTPIQHLPEGTATGQIPSWNGTNWVTDGVEAGSTTLDGLNDISVNNPQNNQLLVYSGALAAWTNYPLVATITDKRQAIFTVEGDLETGANPIAIDNRLGLECTITEVFLRVRTAPTGQAIIADIHKNGTTIFTTQSNRPQITAGNETGYSTTIEVSSWANGEYLTMEIDQKGSGTAGANLIVTVVYTVSISVSFQQLPEGTLLHAYNRGRDTSTDNQIAYLKGGVSDNQIAYTKGQLTDSDNQSAYLTGN